jgi:hypothetical protein
MVFSLIQSLAIPDFVGSSIFSFFKNSIHVLCFFDITFTDFQTLSIINQNTRFVFPNG